MDQHEDPRPALRLLVAVIGLVVLTPVAAVAAMLFLPAAAVASSAFCVWLAVRIVNRRERWAIWTLAGLLGLAALLAALNQATEPPRFIFGSPY
jgi:hypothetical protein